MTQLYGCDNCGDHVDFPKMTLYRKNPVTHSTSLMDDGYYEAYHVCEDCWDELGWDDDS